MPATSKRQRRWAFGVMGPEWAKKHHFDKVKPPRKRRKKRPPR